MLGRFTLRGAYHHFGQVGQLPRPDQIIVRLKKGPVNDLPKCGFLQRTAFEIVLQRLHPGRVGNEVAREPDRLDRPLGSQRETDLKFSKWRLPCCRIREVGAQGATVRNEVGRLPLSRNGRALGLVEVVVEACQPELLGKAVPEQPNDLVWCKRPPEDFAEIVDLVRHKELTGKSPLRVHPVEEMRKKTHIPLDKHAPFIQHGSAVFCHKRVPANRQPLDRQKILARIEDFNPAGFQAVQHPANVTIEDLKRRDEMRVGGEEERTVRDNERKLDKPVTARKGSSAGQTPSDCQAWVLTECAGSVIPTEQQHILRVCIDAQDGKPRLSYGVKKILVRCHAPGRGRIELGEQTDLHESAA